MADTAATGAMATPRWKIVLLELVVLYLLALKLWFGIAVTPMGDEAYYWMWGQHLSWSYFDHPPLDGWLQGLVAAIFGWSNLSVRLLSWLTLVGTLWIFWLWSARFAPGDRHGWFWHTAVIYLTIPVVYLMSSFAFHDHLLMFLVVASLYFFHGFAGDWEDGRRVWWRLYAAAALLGLAVLTKYNGVFLGLGYAVWVLARPRLRALLLTPHLWLAALLAIAIQAPVIYWNLTEGLASFRYHFLDRPTSNWGKPRPQQVLDYFATMALLLSPVLFLSLFRVPWMRKAAGDEHRAFGLSMTVFLTSTLGWAAIAVYIYVYLHWNIVAYVALAPILWRLVGGRIVFALHVAYGLLLITVAMLNYTVTPIKLLGFGDTGAAAAHGWVELGERVKAQQAAHPDAFLGATRYTYAAQIGFVLHDTDVAAFNPVASQNDYWWDSAAHAGRDALIIADRKFKASDAADHFASLEQLETVDVRDMFGTRIWRFEIWLGKDYGAASP
jgi:4-amino-4-deoxy-L-arabinose transferase-like glycosyltransferase